MAYIGRYNSSNIVDLESPVSVNSKTVFSHDSQTDAITLSADGAVISGSSTEDLVRITQTGTGNALVVEDDTNPDSSPFVVDSSGFVGIGTSSPTVGLELNGVNNTSRLKLIDGNNQVNFGLWDGSNYRIEGDANRKILITSYHTDGVHLGSSGASDLVVKSGNVGIGMAPTQLLDLNATSGISIRFYNGGTFKGGMQVVDSAGQMISSSVANDFTIRSQSDILFSTGGNTERMRIDASGKSEFFGAGVYALQGNGVTSQSFRVGTDDRWKIRPNSGNAEFCLEYAESTSLSDANIKFKVLNTGASYNSSGTWGTLSSDIRVKENIVNATSKLNDLLNLRVVNFNYINNQEKLLGFVAQEFQEIFPNLVTTYDTREYDENGNVISGYEDMLGLKVGVEFAVVVKAIQEQQTIIESQESQIDSLQTTVTDLLARIEALEAV